MSPQKSAQKIVRCKNRRNKQNIQPTMPVLLGYSRSVPQYCQIHPVNGSKLMGSGGRRGGYVAVYIRILAPTADTLALADKCVKRNARKRTPNERRQTQKKPERTQSVTAPNPFQPVRTICLSIHSLSPHWVLPRCRTRRVVWGTRSG